jgi:threonine dehydrogenase-like Zn-dependent dehydrogenase
LSFVKFARLLGLGEVYSVDPLPEKRQKALEMGATVTYAPDDPELAQAVEKRGQPFDAVIDAVGKEGIINSGLSFIGMDGKICVYGVIDTPTISLEKIKGPYNFNLLIHQWPTRFREAAAQEQLCKWVEQGQLSHKEFISVEFPITEINQALAGARTGKPIKTLLRF